MNQNQDESLLRELFTRFLDNRCSDDEIRLLMEYAGKEEYREIFSGMMSELGMDEHLSPAALYALHKAVIDDVSTRITPPLPARKTAVRRWLPYKMAAAAVALLLLATGIWRWYSRPSSGSFSTPLIVAQKTLNDLPPGGKKAVLILANGASITLDSAANGVLTRQGYTQVINSTGGNLVYTADPGQTAEPLYNTVITPRGGQYQVTLSDGTKIWLNAASSLRFPAAFTGTQRQVALTGEAYFEVMKNADKPFIVTVDDMKVTVLGTNFNVMAYRDESAVNTTLLEGSVQVTKGNAAAILQPGQQAQLDGQGKIRLVKKADMNAAIAWKNRLFWFDEDDIHTVMRQLSRAYNIDVEIRGNIQRHFTGSIPRDVNVSTVFEVLQKTGGVHFTMNNGKIIVTP